MWGRFSTCPLMGPAVSLFNPNANGVGMTWSHDLGGEEK